MCGIAGIFNEPSPAAAAAAIGQMNEAQRHRGPDEQGVWQDARGVLGHCRLAVVDLIGGHQPMSNADESVVLVFNGEIYNFPALRRELAADGVIFRNAGDTEVILHLYEKYGREAIGRLHGMFALAIYDRRREKVLLARDRLGQKPLLYRLDGKRLCFASEFAALKKISGCRWRLNYPAVDQFLALQYIPAPATVYLEVHKLLPGCWLEFDLNSGRTVLNRYWQPDYRHKLDISFEDAAVEVRRRLTEAVRKRLMADVPFGAFLSGGLDSAIVCGLMAELCDRPVSVFTVGFENARYDERMLAARTARALEAKTNRRLSCRTRVVQPEDFELLRRLVRHYGEPFADASMLPTGLLCRFAAEELTVALSGDGADEIFAGYERYLAMKYLAAADRWPGGRALCRLAAGWTPGEVRSFRERLRRLLAAGALPELRRYPALLIHGGEAVRRALCQGRLAAVEAGGAEEYLAGLLQQATAVDPVEQCLECDLHGYLPNDILVKVDIASMAASLEVRSPFLDHELVEFAAALPLRFKQCGRSRKHILKAAFADLLPADLRNRRKRGFGVPVGEWFRGNWRMKLQEALLEGRLVSGGMMCREGIAALLETHCSGRGDWSYLLWSLLCLELFLEEEV